MSTHGGNFAAILGRLHTQPLFAFNRGARYVRHLKHEKYYKQVRVIGVSPLVTREWRHTSSELPIYPDCWANGMLPVVTILAKRRTGVAERM